MSSATAPPSALQLKPHHWGPFAWTTLHYWTLGYPEVATADEQQRYATFVRAFGQTLPCQSCRAHFAGVLKEFPPEQYMRTREDFIRWGMEAHNMVNRRLNKKEMTMPEFVRLFSARIQMDDERQLRSRRSAAAADKDAAADVPDWVKWVGMATGVGALVALASKSK